MNETIDSMSAAFYADIIQSYMDKGTIDDISYFNNAYSFFESTYLTPAKTTSLFNYNDKLSEIVNNYIKSQQNLFKGIYNFKQYFNSRASFGSSVLKRGILTINHTLEDGLNYLLAFNQQGFTQITKKFKEFNPLTLEVHPFVFKNDYKTTVETVNINNYQSFYTPNIKFDELRRCSAIHGYSSKSRYYRYVYETSTVDMSKNPQEIEINGVKHKFCLHSETKTHYYFAHETAISALSDKDYPSTITLINSKGSSVIAKRVEKNVSFNEIVSEYLWGIYTNTTKTREKKDWFYHNTNYLKPIYTGGRDPQND
jgi:hypothetical protein